jgi:hypothetical protein
VPKEHPEETTRSIPELLKVLVWPLVVLAVIVIILVTGGSAQNVELGPLKVSFARDLKQTVGAPPGQEVAAAIRRLTPTEMEILITHGPGTGRPICTMGNLRTNDAAPVPREVRENADGYARLVASNLVELRGQASSGDPWCNPQGLKYAFLTDQGESVRRYLVDLLTKSLVISDS